MFRCNTLKRRKLLIYSIYLAIVETNGVVKNIFSLSIEKNVAYCAQFHSKYLLLIVAVMAAAVAYVATR